MFYNLLSLNEYHKKGTLENELFIFPNQYLFKKASETSVVRSPLFSENVSKHRSVLNLYDLKPQIQLNGFVAPNATVVGQVSIGMETQVWYGTVIRGDINEIKFFFKKEQE